MSQKIRFERPPVVEVVFGVLFGGLTNLRAAHIGVFWDRVRDEFPSVDEAPPLLPVIEAREPLPVEEIEIGLVPPFRRTWLRSADGHRLIQLQHDRFIYNWKRDSPEDGLYPSYDKVIIDFERLWGEFNTFVVQENLGELLPRQLELVYVNIIPVDRIPKNDPVFVDHRRDSTQSRFLPDPESFTWRTSYPLPESSGRLHVLAATARQSSTGAPIIRLEVSARGINDAAVPDTRAWFDLAHEWITNGFTDVTTTKMQTEWGRQL